MSCENGVGVQTLAFSVLPCLIQASHEHVLLALKVDVVWLLVRLLGVLHLLVQPLIEAVCFGVSIFCVNSSDPKTQTTQQTLPIHEDNTSLLVDKALEDVVDTNRLAACIEHAPVVWLGILLGPKGNQAPL